MDSDDSRSSNTSESSNSSSIASPVDKDDQKASPENPLIAGNGDGENHDENADDQQKQADADNSNQDLSISKEEEDIELSDAEDQQKPPKESNISHDDLSDISDLESSNDTSSKKYTDLRQKLNKVISQFKF